MSSAASTPIVYVLDDDPSVLHSLDRLVKSAGIDVRTFSSAVAFLARAPLDRPCCLVVDVRMPELSGLDLQETLTASGRVSPIIFITGHGTVPMSVRAMRRGAVNFLQKPFEDHEILNSIREALEREVEARREQSRRSQIESQIGRLTPREREVFALVVSGLPNKRIAGRLGTSEKTIKVHRARVMEKMCADSLASLVSMAHDAGQVPPPDRGPGAADLPPTPQRPRRPAEAGSQSSQAGDSMVPPFIL